MTSSKKQRPVTGRSRTWVRAVSQQIRRLERETGATLLRRSTRHLSLTDAGEAFYAGCAAMVAAARDAHAGLGVLQDDVSGELSISAPVGFATTHLAPALAPLLGAHPKLSLRLVATDDPLDVVRERIDVAVAIGTVPPAATLMRRHLADWANLLVASPAYLAARGTPRTPEALAEHDFIALPAWHHPGDVLTGPRGRRCRVRVRRRVTCNNQMTIRQLALAGCGLSFHVMPEIAEDLAAGRLARVLPAWRLPPLSVDALMPPRARQPAKVRAAVDALRAYLARTPVHRAQPGRRRSGGAPVRRASGLQ